jgi:hypothetical protein
LEVALKQTRLLLRGHQIHTKMMLKEILLQQLPLLQSYVTVHHFSKPLPLLAEDSSL